MLQENLIRIYEASFRDFRELPALTDYFKGETLSYFEVAKEIAKLHMLFKKTGLKPGDRVALIGRNTPKWCVTYLATITYGAVIVPILQDFAPSDVVHIINHSESRLLFVGEPYWDNIEEGQIRQIEGVISLTDFSVVYERSGKSITKFQQNILKHFRTKYSRGFTTNDIKYNDIDAQQMILLNYTSGTTGHSKGVMLSVNNLTGNVVFARNAHDKESGQYYFEKGGRWLSFLPLAHAYGCAFDFLTPLAIGGHVTLLGKIPSPKILLEAMAQVRPTIVCCVPLILEKIYRKQLLPILEKTPVSVAMRVPLLSSAIYGAIRRKLINAFGGSVNLFVVGGAAINQETEDFLMKIKFPVTVGYGMTECGPLISFSSHSEFKPKSCGRYLSEHLEVKINANDEGVGEILVRGEHVMMGYFRNEKETRKVLSEDGWLSTGDLGVIDQDGVIFLKGRSKTMILSGSGQNIYPEQIEDRLNNMYLVMESLIIENNGRLSALVVLDREQMEQDKIDINRAADLMQQNLKELNAMTASFEQVADITIYPTEFEKTPKRSIKRYLYSPMMLNK